LEARLPSSRTTYKSQPPSYPKAWTPPLTVSTMAATVVTSTRFTDEYQLYEELGK